MATAPTGPVAVVAPEAELPAVGQAIDRPKMPPPAWTGGLASTADALPTPRALPESASEGNTSFDTAFMTSAFDQLEQASKALPLLQLRMHAWEFRLFHLRQFMDNLMVKVRQRPAAQVQGAQSGVPNDPEFEVSLKSLEERLVRLLRTIHSGHSEQILSLQQATHALQRQITQSLQNRTRGEQQEVAGCDPTASEPARVRTTVRGGLGAAGTGTTTAASTSAGAATGNSTVAMVHGAADGRVRTAPSSSGAAGPAAVAAAAPAQELSPPPPPPLPTTQLRQTLQKVPPPPQLHMGPLHKAVASVPQPGDWPGGTVLTPGSHSLPRASPPAMAARDSKGKGARAPVPSSREGGPQPAHSLAHSPARPAMPLAAAPVPALQATPPPAKEAPAVLSAVFPTPAPSAMDVPRPFGAARPMPQLQ